MAAGARGDSARGPWRWAYPLALALVLIPFAVAIVATLLDGGHTPISDRALMELRIRDVGIHPVTIGLYSRDGWAHPGPFLYYLLAAPYRLFGSDMNALMVGSLIINAAAVVAMGAIAKRIGGIGAGLVVLVASAAVARALGTELLVDPWVCWVTVLPFGVFCLLTWALADGRIWALPVTALVASLLAQTHVGYAPIAVPGALVGAIWLVVRVRRTEPGRTRALLAAAGGTVVALAVVWAPPLWDQWRGVGNLGNIVRWFRDTKEPVHTLGEAVRIVGGQLAIVPDWITGTRRVERFTGATTLLHTTLVPILLVPVVLAVFFAFRRRDRIARSLLVMLGVTGVAAVASVARTTGTMYEYRLLWTWTLGALVTAAAAFALWRAARTRLPVVAPRVVAAMLLAALVGLAVAQTADALDDRHYVWESTALAQAVTQAETQLRPRGGQVVLTSETFEGNWYQQGALLAFEHDGYDVRVPNDVAEMYGEHRVRGPGPVQAELLVLANGEVAGFTGRPGWEVAGFGAARSLAATAAVGARRQARQRALATARQQGRISEAEFERRLHTLPSVPLAVLILERRR